MQADSISTLRQSLTPTYTSVSSSPRLNLASTYLSTASCPFDSRPTETAQGTLSSANKHVPGTQDTTTWNRFFWIIQYAVSQVRGPCGQVCATSGMCSLQIAVSVTGPLGRSNGDTVTMSPVLICCAEK